LEPFVSDAWAVVLAVGAGTVLLKSLGPVVLAGRTVPRRLSGLIGMLAPALLSALVVVQTFADGRRLAIDPRAAGLGAAALAVAVRAPLLAVVVVAAVATALARAL
jgi:uncharacterized membrane protein